MPLFKLAAKQNLNADTYSIYEMKRENEREGEGESACITQVSVV